MSEGLLPAQWAPPPDLASTIGRSRESKTVTTPIGVEDILAMVKAIPDPRWRLAFQLINAFGLRPEVRGGSGAPTKKWPPAAKPNPGPFGCCRAIHGQRPGTWSRHLIQPCYHQCRWCGDDVMDDAFAKPERRFLGA